MLNVALSDMPGRMLRGELGGELSDEVGVLSIYIAMS